MTSRPSPDTPCGNPKQEPRISDEHLADLIKRHGRWSDDLPWVKERRERGEVRD